MSWNTSAFHCLTYCDVYDIAAFQRVSRSWQTKCKKALARRLVENYPEAANRETNDFRRAAMLLQMKKDQEVSRTSELEIKVTFSNGACFSKVAVFGNHFEAHVPIDLPKDLDAINNPLLSISILFKRYRIWKFRNFDLQATQPFGYRTRTPMYGDVYGHFFWVSNPPETGNTVPAAFMFRTEDESGERLSRDVHFKTYIFAVVSKIFK